MASRSNDTWLDDLFEIPPARFVAARNALAKQLRKEGRKADADAVKKLTKPPAPVWLVDQWARRHRELMQRLLVVLDDLRSAQAGAGLDRDRLHAARTEERTVLAALADVAPALLSEGGLASSPATIERALKTVRAAAASPEHRANLETGRLDREVVESGFDGFADLIAGVDVESVQARREATARARAQATTRPAPRSNPASKTLQPVQRSAPGPAPTKAISPPTAPAAVPPTPAASAPAAPDGPAPDRAAALRAAAEAARKARADAERQTWLSKIEKLDTQIAALQAEVAERAEALADSERRLADRQRSRENARTALANIED